MSINESAFPIIIPNGEAFSGMTLRDYFAGKALPHCLYGAPTDKSICMAATNAYRIADAMLEARWHQS